LFCVLGCGKGGCLRCAKMGGGVLKVFCSFFLGGGGGGRISHWQD